MVEPPIWKICSSNWIISPNRDEHKKCLKPPPRVDFWIFWYSKQLQESYTEPLNPHKKQPRWRSSKSINACCHSAAFSHALMVALQVMIFLSVALWKFFESQRRQKNMKWHSGEPHQNQSVNPLEILKNWFQDPCCKYTSKSNLIISGSWEAEKV